MVAIRSLDITEIEPRVVLHAGGDPLVIPGGNALLTAEFHRLGQNLLIHGQHGTEVLVHDYFAANHAPALMTESGLRLDADLVTALARPEGYLQLAQDQTAQADTNGGAQPIGKVDTMTGSVEVHHADGSTAQLAQGAPVFQGDVIQTGADGQVAITFVDGTAFSLEPGARMTLDDLVYSGDGKNNSFSASVLQGTFVFMAGKIAPSGHMEVKTPVGTIGIRGTTVGGHLSMDGNDNTIVLFRDARTGHLGKVEFTNAGGSQILDTPNASTHVTSFFAAPTAPIPLPPQDAQQYFNDMLQHFYDQHGGAPTGNQGNNSQPGQPTADQLADQMDLGNFDTAAGPGAHGPGGNGPGGHDPLSSLLGYVPPPPTSVVFTSLSLTGGLVFGENGFGGFGNEGPGSHITQDNLGQINPGANGGFTVINGTPGNDNLGSSAAIPGPLQIFGNAGDDVLTGSSFDDQIHGGAGNDILDGGAGNDQVFGDAGNDTFDGGTGLGNDYYDGGDGVDTVEYSSATLNLTVNLTTGTASGDPDIGTDTLVNIENVIGGSGNDTIIGNAADNVLYGGAGNDTLEGMGGNDTLYGGIPGTGNQADIASGTDTAVFRGSLAQYTITETEGGAFIVTDSQAGRDGTDTLIDIARVQFADGTFNLSDLINRPPSAPADANASANQVAENAATGTAVGITANSTDPNGAAVTYSLVGDTSNGGFQIDAKTGVVTVLDGSKIDYETATDHQYQITVQASDGHVTSQSTFTIGVGNEAPSVPTDANTSDNTVQENAATGTAVGITASSADPAGGTVTYSLTNDSSDGGFQVDAQTGVVTVADGSKIDYESAPDHQYQITVQASDGSLTSQSTFTIGVGNEAPSAPADADTNGNTVQENAATGTAVGITASSADPAGGTVTYSLTSDSSNGGFQVDAQTGVVTVADGSKIDYETAPGHQYQITVQASDGSLTSQSTFTIGVGNEAPSVPADADTIGNTVQENAATGTAVGITASSADPAGGTVTYSLTNDSSDGGFQVDAKTGVVTVADGSKIDYESAPDHQYQITVQASDGSLTSQSTFTIGVGNAAPGAPADADTNANATQEHTGTGTAVGITASSTDPAGGTVTYSLVGDTSNGGFQIDAQTGIVTVADGSKIDYETAPDHQYQITVQASDGSLTQDSSFTIQVQPAPPPSIDLDANNSSGDTTTGYQTTFSGQPVGVTDSDAVVTAADGRMIASATLQLTGVTNQSQEALVAGSLPAGISVSSFTYSNGVGTLTLSGLASAADYAAALESIKYENGASGLAAGSRTVTISVTDDIGHVSNTATALIDIAATARIIGDVINGDPLIIGNISHGEVDIFDGGQALVHQIIIGNAFTGNGFLQLNPGSVAGLGAETAITVGNAGIGQLSVSGTASAPGEVDAGQIVIGAQNSGIGTITLNGGSEINATGGTITVGERGLGYLTIQGTSTTPSTAIANQVVIGDQSHGGGVLLVNGSGASLITEGDGNGITVGNQGTGFLGVSNGGLVETQDLEIGQDGTGNAIVGGAGTKVDIGGGSNDAGFLGIGKTDDGNGSLSVIAGALLTIEAAAGADKDGPALMIADEAGSQGNVIIDGDHSAISLSQTGTPSATLEAEDTNALITGPRVIVGHEGDAALTVQNHGLLSLTGQGAGIEIGAGDNDHLAHHLPQSVATVTSGGQITLTDASTGDDPQVAAGGISVGGAAEGNGRLTVTGTGSLVSVQSIDGVTIGDSGTGSLAIGAGGSVIIQSPVGATRQSGLTIARNETANGGVTVSGTGSSLQILSPNIGAGLLEGPFLIMAAGQSLFQVSDHANVLIQGEGANFVVGSEASSLAQASILSGATMTVDGKDGDATVVVASQAGAEGSLTIDGAHSHLTIEGDTDQMLIGAAYNGNQDVAASQSGDADVKVSNGGTLEVGAASIHGGSAEIVIGGHGSLDIANGTVIGDISDQGGEISIGHNAIATATLIGDLDMSSPASTLEIDASGTAAGHADKLNVTGDATLTAATIDFHFLNNYAPHAGDTFSFLTASDGVSVNLSDISLVAHDVSSSFRFELLASENDIQFHALTNAGSGSSDVFLGGDRNDSFTATGNNNALFGGAGDDTLIGGNNGNLIQGGAGADHMTGGKGADTFSFVLPSDGVQVGDNATVAKDSASYDHIINFDAKSDTISFAPGYSQSAISSINDGNFSKIDSAYDGTNGTSAAYKDGQASFILDGNNNLIYDGNGSKAGYTIVAHIDVAPGSPAITAHNLHVA